MSLLLAAGLAVLAGCGSGGSGTTGTTGGSGATATAQSITGTVASGAPLAGATVSVKDSAGKTAVAASAADGAYSLSVTGMTPPFMLVASKAGRQNMYSILPAMDMASTNTQNVDITPVTTLIMYELALGDPASMYLNRTFSTVTAASVSAKQTFVRSRLPANNVNPVFDMMYGKFTASVQPAGANPDPYDALLDSMGYITGITPTNVTFSLAAAYTRGADAAVALSIALTLTDPVTSAARTSVSNDSPVRVTATVTNASGTVVPNAIVTFTTSDPRDTFLGGANTALTNANGIAMVTLTTSNTSGGASAVTASTTVNGIDATNYVNYGIGSSTLSLSALTLPASTLSAYGTASISVNVLNNGAPFTSPITVKFTSACALGGKATLTASVTSINGTATANYVDNGCNNTIPGDTITATLTNGVTATGNLPVGSPTLGSIQFVSVVTNPPTTPTMITIKGTGGAGRSETARVTFRVVDSSGFPLGNALVNFSLNTSLGGLTLSPTSATSDPITGNVVTNVTSGVFSTAVRVTAKSGAVSTQSDQLLISTGIPAQDAISISASTHNIEAWIIDGTTTTLTARLADHFHNPVPDGTAVYFTSEGGSVVPSCTTVGGVCSAVLTSQELRPRSALNGYGRVTVLVRAIGEESFIDLNSNGMVDNEFEMIDANTASTDMGEAYVDYNEDNCRDPATEPYVDFNGDGLYNGRSCSFSGGGPIGDGMYNGVLCTAGAAICSAQKSIDVRGSQIIIFSDSWAASIASLLADYNLSHNAANFATAWGIFNTAYTAAATAQAAFNAAQITYNTALAAWVALGSPPGDVAYSTALGDYNTALGLYNTVIGTYNTAIGTYNTALALYNPPPISVPPVPWGLKPGIPVDNIVLASCTTVAPMAEARPASVTVTVIDTNGNAMPAGTKIDFATDNGTTVNPATWTVPDNIGCRTGYDGCPATAASPTFGDINVTLMSDAAYTPPVAPAVVGACTNTKSGGVFSVKITSPKGAITTYTRGISD